MKNKEIMKKMPELQKCVCFNLKKATRAVTQIYDERLRPCGLRATQLTILFVVGTAESASITHLSQMLVMDRTTLTRNLKLLEKNGLIEINKGKDNRSRMVSLTENGLQITEKALPVWEETQAYVTTQLGKGRWDVLLNNLSAAIALAGKK